MSVDCNVPVMILIRTLNCTSQDLVCMRPAQTGSRHWAVGYNNARVSLWSLCMLVPFCIFFSKWAWKVKLPSKLTPKYFGWGSFQTCSPQKVTFGWFFCGFVEGRAITKILEALRRSFQYWKYSPLSWGQCRRCQLMMLSFLLCTARTMLSAQMNLHEIVSGKSLNVDVE